MSSEHYSNPRHWRLRTERYRLVGEVCPHCDIKIFPPRDICLKCGENTLTKPEAPAEPVLEKSRSNGNSEKIIYEDKTFTFPDIRRPVPQD